MPKKEILDRIPSTEVLDRTPRKEIVDRIEKYVRPFRITKGEDFRLKDFDPAETRGLKVDKGETAELTERGIAWLAEEQEMLYAQNRWSLLLIFQAMDAAGKDSTIKHVMSGVNPQGCQVFSFKQPSSEDLDHDFMWRYLRHLPERGRIGIFNRSYYEEVLVVRVHPEILKRQKLPPRLVGKGIWEERLADIARFEDYVTRQGTKILKFFLHVSRKEQKKRFMARLDEPEKNWKFSASDVKERQVLGRLHGRLRGSDSGNGVKARAWFVVPADNKWFTRLLVGAAIVEALEDLGLAYPKVDAARGKRSRPRGRHSPASSSGSQTSLLWIRRTGGRSHSRCSCLSGWSCTLLFPRLRSRKVMRGEVGMLSPRQLGIL